MRDVPRHALPCAAVFGRQAILLTLALLVFGPSLRVEAQSFVLVPPYLVSGDEPEATITDVNSWRSAGRFLAGVATGFFAHEAGHILANLVQGNVPQIQGIWGFGFIPFFTVAPRISCYEGHCVKHNGEPLSTGVGGKVAITSAGFNVQHVTDELLLSFEPRLRYRVAPYRKGLLAFNVLLSVGYAISAITRIENPEGDLSSTARLMGVPPEVYACTLLAIAGLDTYRYFVPDSRWAPWVSRGAKVAFIGVVFFL
jgi:hypothetical protein